MVLDEPSLKGRTTVSVIPVSVVDENITDRLEDFGVTISLIQTFAWRGNPDLVGVVGAKFAVVIVDAKLKQVAMVLLTETTKDGAVLIEISFTGGICHDYFLFCLCNYYTAFMQKRNYTQLIVF